MGLTFKLGTIPLAILTDASNNVGIGAAPSGSYKLEVTGTAKVSSTLLLGGALTGTSATFSGNVGIGTASSTFALDTLLTDASTNTILGVAQIGRATTGTAANGIGGNLQFTAEDTAGTQRTAAYITWKLAAASSASPQDYLSIGSRNASEALTILDSGNVGIGVSSPIAKLQVYGIDSTTSSLADVWGSGVFRVTPRPNSSDAALMITNAGSTTVLGISAASSATTALPIALNPFGGFVGVNGATTPAAPITVYDQTSGSAGEQIRLCNSNGGGYWGIGRENNVTGDLYIGNGTLRAKIQPSGNLVLTRTTYSSIQAVGCYDDTSAGSRSLSITSAGSIVAVPSSLRYKKDVETLDSNISESIYKMRPIWYRSISNHDRDDWSWYGLIAEEIAEIEPRLVQWGYKR